LTSILEFGEEDILVRIRQNAALMHVRYAKPKLSRGTLILIHGYCGNSDDFNSCYKYFPHSGFSVVGVDMPGRGQSARLRLEYYQLDVFIEVLKQIINHYSSGPTLVIGKSWGGALALLAVSALGNRQPALALLDVSPIWNISSDPEMVWAKERLHRCYHTLDDAHKDLMRLPGFRHINAERRKAFISSRLTKHADGYRHNCDPAIISNQGIYEDLSLDLTTKAHSIDRIMILSRYPDSWAKLADTKRQSAPIHFISVDKYQNDPFVNSSEMLALLGFAEQLSRESLISEQEKFR